MSCNLYKNRYNGLRTVDRDLYYMKTYKSTTEENYSFRVALKVSQQKKYKKVLKNVQKWL